MQFLLKRAEELYENEDQTDEYLVEYHKIKKFDIPIGQIIVKICHNIKLSVAQTNDETNTKLFSCILSLLTKAHVVGIREENLVKNYLSSFSMEHNSVFGLVINE